MVQIGTLDVSHFSQNNIDVSSRLCSASDRAYFSVVMDDCQLVRSFLRFEKMEIGQNSSCKLIRHNLFIFSHPFYREKLRTGFPRYSLGLTS